MFKIHCKQHYRSLATYSWCTTLREHVTKTAPARRRHSVGGGAAAAAHSSTVSVSSKAKKTFDEPALNNFVSHMSHFR